MTLTLPPETEARLRDYAAQSGYTPEAIADAIVLVLWQEMAGEEFDLSEANRKRFKSQVTAVLADKYGTSRLADGSALEVVPGPMPQRGKTR